MRGTLYGLTIPDAATHVEVRPVYSGAGRRRALFRGALESDGLLITEDDIHDAVVSDAKMWLWLDAARKNGSAPAGEPGVLKCRVSVQFLDQGGAPISVNDAGGTWATSPDVQEFLRPDAAKPESAPLEGLLAAQTSLIATALGQVTKALERLPEIVRSTVEESCKGAAAIMDKGAAPLTHAVTCLVEENKAAHKRADDATEALVKQLVAEPKKSSGDTLDLLAKGVTLFAAVSKLKPSQPN